MSRILMKFKDQYGKWITTEGIGTTEREAMRDAEEKARRKGGLTKHDRLEKVDAKLMDK